MPNRDSQSENQKKLCITALENLFSTLEEQLSQLSFESREIFIETCCSILLDGLVPISGMTIQKKIALDSKHIAALNQLTQNTTFYKNYTNASYVYKYPREATSAGVIPAYQDTKTGDIFIVLICNKRNLNLYNWSAGYSEAPPPTWKGKYKNQEIYYNQEKLLHVAKKFMLRTLAKVENDWTKVIYDHALLEKEFQTENVVIPATDFNSLHTAMREGHEEINLDLTQFPERKNILITHDNTLGISQSDAPGQVSNRAHHYLVFLGSLDQAPDIMPGDDVAIAEWINVSDIMRASPTEYSAHGKPLSIYMLRGLELALKYLRNHLIEQSSTLKTQFNSRVARFANAENLAAEIELICKRREIAIDQHAEIKLFLNYLSGDLPNKTYTGKTAQHILNCSLQIAAYLAKPEFHPDTFLAEINKILLSLT